VAASSLVLVLVVERRRSDPTDRTDFDGEYEFFM